MSKARWAVLGVLVLAAGLAAWRLLPSSSGGPDIGTRLQHSVAPSLSSALIAQDDLPPEGTRSLFDHLVAQNDGLPYPFEKLLALIQSQHPQGSAPAVLMIPDGRSLLKASADYRHPRVLVAADFQGEATAASLGQAPRGQLFLGFVEDANEIEVLSYNEAAGRFEFQLVQDYSATGARRIVYARRQICTTCHQGATPIFPQRPWNETNGQPETAARILEARGSAEPYLTAPLANPLGVPERFDQLTDVGGFIPVTQRLWLEGCGGAESSSADCRRQMLKTALLYLWNPLEFDAQSAPAQRLRQLQAAHWPTAGVAVAGNDLPNRDPLGERKGVSGFLRTLLTPVAKPGEGARDNEDLAAFERLPKLPSVLDPLTPRAPKRVLSAQDLDGAFGLATLISESDFRLLEAAAGHDRDRLLSAVDAAAPALFTAQPFVRVHAVNGLLTALREKPRDYCCLAVAEMSPPVAATAPRVQLSAGSPLEPFQTYCFACHRGNPAKRLDFMSGATEAEILEQLKARPEIRDALDWTRYQGTEQQTKLMPPADSPQHAQLAEALKAQPQLLEQMRAVVPGLFDF